MYPQNLSDIADPKIRRRIAVERLIVNRVIDEALAAGYELSVHDGEERHPWTTDRAEVTAAIMNTDEDALRLRRDGIYGVVVLIYGNGGWDVIADYSVSLSDLMDPIMAYADTLEA